MTIVAAYAVFAQPPELGNLVERQHAVEFKSTRRTARAGWAAKVFDRGRVIVRTGNDTSAGGDGLIDGT